jgi:hypothetical protein
MKVWNGLTPKRNDLSTVKATSHEDYLVLVQQIQQLQEFVLSLSMNTQIMPNLEGLLKKAEEKIQQVNAKLKTLTLPQDVKDKLVEIDKTIEEIDKRAEVTSLRRDFEALKERVLRNQIEVLQLQNSFATEVKGFQNQVWGILTTLQKDMNGKWKDMAEKMEHLDVQLDLQANLDKLSKLQASK